MVWLASTSRQMRGCDDFCSYGALSANTAHLLHRGRGTHGREGREGNPSRLSHRSNL